MRSLRLQSINQSTTSIHLLTRNIQQFPMSEYIKDLTQESGSTIISPEKAGATSDNTLNADAMQEEQFGNGGSDPEPDYWKVAFEKRSEVSLA